LEEREKKRRVSNRTSFVCLEHPRSGRYFSHLADFFHRILNSSASGKQEAKINKDKLKRITPRQTVKFCHVKNKKRINKGKARKKILDSKNQFFKWLGCLRLHSRCPIVHKQVNTIWFFQISDSFRSLFTLHYSLFGSRRILLASRSNAPHSHLGHSVEKCSSFFRPHSPRQEEHDSANNQRLNNKSKFKKYDKQENTKIKVNYVRICKSLRVLALSSKAFIYGGKK